MNDDSDFSDCLVIDTDPEEIMVENNEVANLSSDTMGNITSQENVLIENGRVEKKIKSRNDIRINVKMDSGMNVKRFIQSDISPYTNNEISFSKPSSDVSTSTMMTTPPNNLTNVNVFHHGHQNIPTTVVKCNVIAIPNNNINGYINYNILKKSSAKDVAIPNDLQPKNLLSNGCFRRIAQRFGTDFAVSLKYEKDIYRVRRMLRLDRFESCPKNGVRTHNEIGKTKKLKRKRKIEKKRVMKIIKENVNIKSEGEQVDSKLNCSTADGINSTVSEKEKRMIIIDGSNVAFGHGQTNFSVKGVELSLEHFEKQGFQVKAICPQMRLKQNQSTDPIRLEALVRQKKVLLTPCKHLPGSFSTSYDDKFILEIAAAFDGAIISNDNFRDLWNQNSEWNNIIEKRVIGYVWCNDKLFLPSDPYGRNGPSLEDILYKERKKPIEMATKVQEILVHK